MEGEFQDWEFLHSSDETGSVNSSDSVDNMGVLKGIDVDDSQGMIRTDHFSLDSQDVIKTTVEGHVESDNNPNWINPGSEETRSPRKELGDFCPDSGEDPSECRHKFGEFDDKIELGFVENEKIQVGFEEIGAGGEDLGKFWSDSGGIEPISMEFGGLEHDADAEIGVGANPNSPKGSEILAEEEKGGDATLIGEESVAVGAVVKPSGEKQKRSVVWWKVPFEFLKYCAFRVSPVWTFSVAAAVMGFVILGRRLYKMKRKSQSLQLKVTMDDKKVSQFMTRTARLNEAFSVVKRVPVVQPSLPVAGVTPWPVMSLR